MHRRRSTAWLLVAAGAALAACQQAETPEQAAARMTAETDAARPAIEARTAAYARHYNAAQTDTLVALHTADAHVMPPNSPAVHGSEGIRAFFVAGFQQGPGGQLALRGENLAVNGPMALERGRWNFTPATGTPIPADSGKYFTHYHMTGDQWLIAEVIWNSDVPLPTPTAPPARRR